VDLIVEVDGPVAVLTLNRPEARNALTNELVGHLGEALVELDGDEAVAAVVLTGTDPAFCAGFDLKKLATEVGAATDRRGEGGSVPRGLLPDHETPVIGAVNGPAVTGGLELALSCDFLVASERARFADTHARVGVMPGGGMTLRLPQLVGLDRARRMSLTGDFIDAATAERWGLVTEVVAHHELLPRVRALGLALAGVPRAAVRELRRMYREVGDLSGEAAWTRERAWSREWMAGRFDQARLAAEREAIMARGRGQA
jgi:enoyl-CoA hydratase